METQSYNSDFFLKLTVKTPANQNNLIKDVGFCLFGFFFTYGKFTLPFFMEEKKWLNNYTNSNMQGFQLTPEDTFLPNYTDSDSPPWFISAQNNERRIISLRCVVREQAVVEKSVARCVYSFTCISAIFKSDQWEYFSLLL